MQTLILGAGAWGTALAVNASLHRPGVRLWARDPQRAEAMRQGRENSRYLPGVSLPDGLAISGAPLAPALLDGVDLVVLACPMAGLRASLLALQAAGCGSRPVAWLCKGFEAPQPGLALGLLGHELAQQVAPNLLTGVLSGPSFAQEVAACKPTALVAASRHAPVQAALVAAFHNPHLRVYANGDVAGVEVGGAVKNVLAIATGLCDGLDLGLNARAALVTRGLAEMGRLGQALGAQRETFMGLSGLGDLVLTATGDLSRNRKVGQLLAQGLGLAQAVDSLGHVAEGVYSARTVVQRARALGLDMPISEAVVALLEGHLQPQAAVQALMEREPKAE